MNWAGWSQFWWMGGQGFFVWGTFGVTLAALVAEVVLVRARERAACLLVQRTREADR